MVESRDLGRYEILEQIGEGGMAIVHLARQRDLDRLVALKELGSFHGSDPTWASRFLRESRLAGALTHAHIVTVFDYFEVAGTPYIAMEYLERGSLRPLVRSLDTAQMGGVLAGLLAGLSHAERRGIVHRDLKPENLLVTAEGTVKIADFGIAKATSTVTQASFKTEAGVAIGTPGYMSPEQAMAREIGPWTDLYSVGCIAYEMSVGDLPFPDVIEPFALMMRHITEAVVPPRVAAPGVAVELSDWVEWLLQKEPSARPQSAREAWEALEEILVGLLGAHWRRESALPAEPVDGPEPQRLTSTVLDPARLAAELGEPAPEVPDALPGPYTPAPADAVLSAELAALDPEPADGDAFTTFRPPGSGDQRPATAFGAPTGDGRRPATTPAFGAPGRDGQRPATTPDPATAFRPAVVATPPPAAATPPATAFQRAVVATPPPTPAAPGAAPSPSKPAAPGAAPSPSTPAAPGATPSPSKPAADDAVVAFEPWPAKAHPAPEPALTEPVRLAPPAPPPPERRRSAWAIPAGVAVVAAAALVAFFALKPGGKPEPPLDRAAAGSPTPAPVRATSLSAGPLGVTLPAGSSTQSGAESPRSLGLTGTAKATPPGGGDILIGRLPASASTYALLPSALLQGGRAPGHVDVTLGAVKAYRYDGLEIDGDRLTVYAVPTTAGVAVIACKECASVAGSLKLTGVQAFPLGPSDDYANAAAKTLRGLPGSGALGSARTPRGQASAAGRNRRGLAGAARDLRRLKLSPADAAANRSLAAALSGAATGFDRLASAARAGDRSRYGSATRAIGAAYRDLGAALDRLEIAGYARLPRPGPPAIPALRRAPAHRQASPSSTPTTPRATPTPSPPQGTTRVTPAPTSPPKPKPTPIPAKPTPVPIGGNG